MAKQQYLLNANDVVALESDLAAKQEKIYTTSSTTTFTAPSTVTVTSGSTSKTLYAQYSGLTLVDGDWICNVYFEGDGVADDVEFSTSDGGHTESETSVNFGTQSLSIVIDQTTFTGSVAISATRTATTAYCGAEADKTPTEDSNKLVTSGGVYDAVEAAIAADVTHAKSISATGVSTPCEPDEDGNVDVSSLFSSDNTSLGGTIRYSVDTPTPTAPTVADTYAAGVAYAVGDHVIVSNVAYVCTTAVATSTTWATDSASFAAFDSSTATAYAISTAYAVGASVTYNGNNYLCIAAVTTTANTSWSAVVASFIGTVHSAVTVADFTINTVDSSAKDYCNITFPAARSDGKARDFIIRYICGVAPTFPAGITVESDTAFAEWEFTVGKTYYMSFTETASGVWLGCLKEIA